MSVRRCVCLAALLLAAGCGEGADAPAAPEAPAAAPALTAPSARGGFEVTLATEDGAAIPLNEPFAVALTLTGPDGAPLGDADSVTLDARMPAHRHGMLRDVELEQTGPGRFRAEGVLFHMVGHWEFHVDVVRGPRVERATLDVWLEP